MTVSILTQSQHKYIAPILITTSLRKRAVWSLSKLHHQPHHNTWETGEGKSESLFSSQELGKAWQRSSAHTPSQNKRPSPTSPLHIYNMCKSLYLFLSRLTGISNRSAQWARGSLLRHYQGHWVCECGWYAAPIETSPCHFERMPAFMFRAFSSSPVNWNPSCAL